MTWNIFVYEIKHWFKQPVTYIFACIFFVFGFCAMAISGDILGEMDDVEGSKAFANSSLSILSYFYDLNLFILFLIPIFIGGSIYRDYSSNSFMVMYSYPIKKLDYFLGKFLSGIFITTLILFLIGAGLYFASLLPRLNPWLMGSNSIRNYILPYSLVVIPNLLSLGMIVFSMVLLSRNSYTGFTTILLIYVFRKILLFILSGPDNQPLIILLDPFGQTAILNSIQNWSISEINNFRVPVSKMLILNRILWIGVSYLFVIFSYHRFSLSQSIKGFQLFKKSKEHTLYEKEKTKQKSTAVSFIAPVYSFRTQLFSTWKISNYEFKSILKSKAFLALLIGNFFFMFLLLGQVNPQYTTRIQPITQVMLLVPAIFYSFVVMIITFLYSGILIHRDRRSRIAQLVDVCAISNWSLLGSKFLTLLKLQAVLLSVIMITGIAIQAWNGYFYFEIPLYFFNIYGILFITLAIWAMMALFVQTVVPNQYIGFFLLITLSIGFSGLDNLGIKQDIFKFNSAPLTSYSDLSGFGDILPSYFIHKLYWLFFGSILLITSYLFWLRGVHISLNSRLRIVADRFSTKTAFLTLLLLLGFFGTGFLIYTTVYPQKPIMEIEELDLYKVEAERKYSSFKKTTQPRLSKVKMNMNIFPKERNYTTNGTLFYVNKSTQPIDTLLLNYPNGNTIYYSFDRDSKVVVKDSILRFDVYDLLSPLLPSDTLQLAFKAFSIPSSTFKSNSQVSSNGTFLLADLPFFGYPEFELSNKGKRNSYGLPAQQNTNLHPSDSLAERNSYVGKNVDLFDYETILSTSKDQIALSSGKLINKWIENDRAYFQYKSETKIRNGIVFNSGRFEVLKDSAKGVSLEIYYHKSHDFNLDRMMRAMKATLEYSSKYFGDYPFSQLRIIEFPKHYGNFAQSFANTIPISEFAGFISKQDESENRFDDVFRLTAHEMAHQWWGHQLVPADALGSRVLTESLAEFTALKVLEQEYGTEKKNLYLRTIRNNYFEQRNRASSESPLSLAEPNEAYVHYAKGLMVFNSLNEYLGNKLLNSTLKEFFQEYKSTTAPYPTSLDLVNHFKENTPDSLQYLIADLFETVTLYDNSIKNAQVVQHDDDFFEVNVEFNSSKFRDSDRTQLLPLNDWIEIGVFEEKGELIHSKKYLISSTENELVIKLKQKPSKIMIDPFTLLLEENIDDNEFRF